MSGIKLACGGKIRIILNREQDCYSFNTTTTCKYRKNGKCSKWKFKKCLADNNKTEAK